MLVEGILPQGSLTGLTAQPGVGKTWFTLELARAVATGGKFLNTFQSKPGSAVFVGQDASIFDYARQLRKLLVTEYDSYEAVRQYEPHAENPLRDRLHFIIQQGILLDSTEWIEALAEAVNAIQGRPPFVRDWIEVDPETGDFVHLSEEVVDNGVDLIILDTLSAMKQANENDNTEMERLFRNLRWLTHETHAAVILIHHNSRQNEYNGGDGWRGASSGEGALDNWLQLRRLKSGQLRCTIKKFRGITPEPFNYDMEIDEEHATLTCQVEASEGNTLAQIVAAIPRVLIEPQTSRAIVTRLREHFPLLAESTVEQYTKRCLTALRKEGKIIKRHDGVQGTFTYSLS